MPDYYGDQATVMPSNTAALLHFSDQFAQMAERRRQEKAMQEREDQQMRNRVNSAISSHIFNPNFLKTDGSNPQMQGLMSQYANEALNKLKTEGEQSAYQYIYDKTGELNGYNQALKQAHENVVNAATNYAKDNPGVQKEALANLLSSKMFSKTDANGNIIPKDLSEIDPTQNYIQDVLKEHGQDLYSEGSSVAALNKDIQGLATDNPKVPSNIDNKGNIISRGYSATKFPSKALDVVPDGRGGFTTQLKSQDYSLDGKTPYVDQNGQTVKVLPPELQSYFGNNNAIAAKVERMTRQQLSDVNAMGQQIDRDSPYGEMLYQKNLYDFVNGGLKDRYSVNADDAEKQARAIRDKNFSQGIQQAHLNLSKQNTNMSAERLQMQKDKQAGKTLTDADGNPIESNFDTYTKDYQTIPNPVTGQDIKYIDAGSIPKDKYYQITGNKPSAVHGDVGGVQPIDVDGKKVFILNDNGELVGDGGEIIDKAGADQRQIKAIPKSKVTIKPTIIQRATNAVKTVVKKVKGTDKKLY
jgi:hypothetical protein